MKKYFSYHIRQSSNNDCGVACIFMLLKKYGYNANYYALKKYFNPNDYGITVKQITDFLSSINVNTKIFFVKNVISVFNYNFEKSQFPCIGVLTLENNNHFILIYKIRHGKIIYSDPYKSSIEKDDALNYLKKIKVILQFDFSQCTPLPEWLCNEKKNFVITNILNDKKTIFRIFLLSMVISFFNIILSTKMGVLVDFFIPYKINLLIYVFGFGIIILLNLIIVYIKNILTSKLSKKIEYNLSSFLSNNILHQEFEDFESFKTGEIVSRINDCMSISLAFSNFFINILPDILILVFSFFLIYSISSKLILILLVPLFINILIAKYVFSKIYKLNYQSMETYARYNGTLVETIEMLKDIKATHSEKYHMEKLNNNLMDVNSTTLYQQEYMILVSNYQRFSILFAEIFIIAFGGSMVIMSEITIGNLMVFSTIFGIIQSIIIRFVEFQFHIENFLIGYNRILQVIKENNNTKVNDKFDRYILKNKINKVSFNNFSIYYNNDLIIENVNIEFTKKNIILKGDSGCGKSSLARILSGLKKNYYGEILVNDIPLSCLDFEQINRKIIYVSNEISIFEGSILDNLSLGKNVLHHRLIQVCKDFNIMDLINNYPDGFYHKINNDQSNISTGEKQRLSIARAMLLQPEIVIFDEALSNIDRENRNIILNNLKKYDCIKIFISHDSLCLDDYQLFEFNSKKIIDRGIINEVHNKNN